MLPIKSSTFPFGYTGTNTSASFICFKGFFSSNREGVKLLIFLSCGEFKSLESQTLYCNISFAMSVAISVSNHQVKEQNHPPNVSLKDSRAMHDTTIMHIVANFPLNETLL